jgi:hypothetical protein
VIREQERILPAPPATFELHIIVTSTLADDWL